MHVIGGDWLSGQEKKNIWSDKMKETNVQTKRQQTKRQQIKSRGRFGKKKRNFCIKLEGKKKKKEVFGGAQERKRKKKKLERSCQW